VNAFMVTTDVSLFRSNESSLFGLN